MDADRADDAAAWDTRYRSSSRIWSGEPNAQLVAEASGLEPGTALDVGCGEGADAIWLAHRGWTVTGVDISQVALERAAEHAVAESVAEQITWQQGDLLADPPAEDAFDLVTVHFMHLWPEPRHRLFTSLAAAVPRGGRLLIVGHHPSDLETGVGRPPFPEVLYTADEIAELLDDTWEVEVAEARPRPGTTPEGAEVTVHDSVLLARHLVSPAG